MKVKATLLVPVVMVAAGALLSGTSDAVAVALIVIGSGMFFIASLAPALSEFKIGPGGFSAKLRERGEEVRSAVEPDAESLVRTATWLTGSPQAGKELVEQALVETYMRWPEAKRRGPTEAVREQLTSLAPPPPAPRPTQPAVARQSAVESAADLLAEVVGLPAKQRSAVVLRLLEGIDIGDVASILHSEGPAVAEDVERAAAKLAGAVAGGVS